ncbi:DUF5018 domain-containing protein [Vescimonas sanitatis]|uniref:DUF5018 domain-containing protein n=1 Tax=Vescimonas sanitatis TaxID=3376993 RepID=UPI003B785299
MKKTTHNFKKPLRSALAMALALVMTLSLTVQAFAAVGTWPATGTASGDRYLQNSGTFYNGSAVMAPLYANFGGFINVYGVPQGSDASSYVMTPTSIYFGDNKSSKDNKADIVLNNSYDFSRPIRYNLTAADGRTFPVYTFAAEATSKETWTEANTQELLGMAELFADTYHQLYLVIDKINAAKTNIGAYHPANADMLGTLGYWLGMDTAFYDDDTVGMGGNRLFDSYEAKWRAGGEEAVQFMQEYLQRYITKKGYSRVSPAALRIIYEQIVPEYLSYVEQNRIKEPVIDRVTIGGSVGSIDAAARTVTVKLPKNVDRSQLTVDVEVGTGLIANSVAGSVAQGSLAYQVTPYDPAYGTKYNALSATWRIIIETGKPDNLVTSFTVTADDGKTRYAKIDETNKTIFLNLPEGTDLSAITPVVVHTGTAVTLEGSALDGSISFDFTNSETTPLTMVVTNSNFALRTEYRVTVTARKSSENYITAYKLGDAEGVIDGDNIAITIPYAMDLAAVEPEITISEFAALTAPDALKEGENTYTVTAEDGTERVYTVTITRTAVATGRQILSFTYGAVAGTIDQVNGTISLGLPAGTSTTFAPAIRVSDFATVTPASGEARDFSKPVKYKVTAQNGSTTTYTVTVTVSQEQAENPYKADMESLISKINQRYSRTTAGAWEDWEWMNLGFYQKKLGNLDDGFSIAECIKRLDTTTNVAMTNIDRKIMTLTARGIDCSKLSKYNNGEPFIDAKGNKVDDLAAILYNYSGGYTINGPIFALNALDMGNYTIPENAVWTREKLLETILNHKYLSDGFGLDMVTMLMQSIAPYQNDPVYGERVKAKLWEGFDIVMDSFGTDPFDNPFGVQWGGVYTSEGASQIICALSAMGVDVHTDVRLNNGKDSVLTSFLNYADFVEGYFAHSNTTPKNAMATYQGCYATQWYLGFLNGGGAGHPYSLYYHRFDFSRKLSTEADITSFTLEGKKGVFTTEGGDNIITVTLPAGTPLNDMHPQLQLSDYATILAPDLTGGITFVKDTKTAFTVQAEDGKTTKTYYVVVKLSDEEKPSGAEIYTDTIMLKDANILRDLDILGKNITTGTDSTDIELLLDAGKDTSNLMIYARLSYGATASPALDGKKGMNLSDWTTFTITSGDGTNTRTYRIKATARTQASISAFSLTIGGTVYEGVIDNKANTITVSGVDDSNLSSTSFAPDVTLGPETLVCSPAPGLAQDFSRTVQYIVAGNEKVLSRTYTVSVLNKAGQLISGSGGGGGSDPVTPATGAKITAFSVLGVDGVINQSAGTITVTLPAGTNVTAVAPSVTVTAGAVVSPVPGEVVNLTAPVVYTVTLGEETSRYTVTVTFERSVSQQLWDELGNNSDVADHQTSHTKRDWS